jgi:hypothetical protein
MLHSDWNPCAASIRLPGRSPRSASEIVTRLLAVASVVVALSPLVPRDAEAARINSAGDPALAGALVQNFDSSALAAFASQSFLIGSDGFTISSTTSNVQITNTFCGNFGTTGACFDTLSSSGAANDDVDVVFTGAGVSAFGFAINALDIAWTVTTFGAGNTLLGTYVINSQSPGLTGDARRGYFGATESAAIQSIQIRSSAGSDRALIDDFAYVPVPEPGAALLIGLGLAVLGGSRARATNPAELV